MYATLGPTFSYLSNQKFTIWASSWTVCLACPIFLSQKRSVTESAAVVYVILSLSFPVYSLIHLTSVIRFLAWILSGFLAALTAITILSPNYYISRSALYSKGGKVNATDVSLICIIQILSPKKYISSVKNFKNQRSLKLLMGLLRSQVFWASVWNVCKKK